MTELDITLRDGRTLHVYDYGDSDGNVLIEHHGTPGSGLAFPRDLELARERGLRSIRYDRAGYGGSTPNPGRSVVDVVADIDDVLDALGIERYVTLGGSGGCPHSFACGARSERCLANECGQPPEPPSDRATCALRCRGSRLARGPGRCEPGGVGCGARRPRSARGVHRG